MENDDIHGALSDEELVSILVKDNDPFVFGKLYDRYAKTIYNKCLGFSRSEDEAKDLTQDVFLLLFVKLRTFEARSKFATWLYAFTYNFCCNYVNRNRERKMSDKTKSLDEDDETMFPMDVPDETLFELKVSKLKKALELIPPEDKALLLLKYQDEVPIKELHELMDIGESAIKMRLKRAKIKVIETYNNLR